MGAQTEKAISSLKQQRLLLELEYNTDKECFRQQTEETGIMRMVRRGDAWFPLTVGKSHYNSLNQKVIEITRNNDTDIEHNFEYGKPVSFFTIEKTDNKPHIRYLGLTSTVSFVEGNTMLVVIPDDFSVTELSVCGQTGIQLYFDETSYRTMFNALDKVISAEGRLAYLRDLFYSGQKAAQLSFAPMRFPYLNSTQETAVNKVLAAKDVAIVHGPPGTGKTTTLVEVIHETLRRESQVLVCAQSNMAVDWISEKLTDRGINVLRIGNPSKVNDKILSHTYERRFEAHPDYPHLWSIRKAIRELRSSKKRGDSIHDKIQSLRNRATEIEIRINNRLFDEARVIASTMTGSANRILEGKRFGTVFIDEAAQALEAACWIPIQKASRVILAGDHCQLPPTVKSIAAMKAGLGKTLMERIVENKPEAVTLLRTQYRMNDDIMRFSSKWFYNGEVEAAPEVKFRSILDYDVPIEWIDTSSPEYHTSDTQKDGCRALPTDDFKEQFSGNGFGRINKGEAELTLDVLKTYFTRIGKQRVLDERIDVGVISPYRAQVQHLRRLLRKREYFKPFRKLISVNTVDGFQGQERDVILISMVRSNEKGEIGFLRDLRRMNVAITRARMKLIILGDRQTMARHPFYKELQEYIRQLHSHRQ